MSCGLKIQRIAEITASLQNTEKTRSSQRCDQLNIVVVKCLNCCWFLKFLISRFLSLANVNASNAFLKGFLVDLMKLRFIEWKKNAKIKLEDAILNKIKMWESVGVFEKMRARFWSFLRDLGGCLKLITAFMILVHLNNLKKVFKMIFKASLSFR